MDFINTNLLPWLNDQALPVLNKCLAKAKDNRTPIASAVAAVAICYLAAVRSQRYKYINELRRKYPDPSIALKDSKVAEEVFDTTLRKEFPGLHYLSFQVALYRTITIPSITKLITATGEAYNRPQKREEDTYLLLHEMLDVYPHLEKERKKCPHLTEEQIDNQVSRRTHAIARMNEIHARYRILHGDFLYQLVLFITEPIYWINKFGYRKLDQLEINAYMHANAKFYPTNKKISDKTLENTARHFPVWQQRFVKMAFPCMVTPIDAKAFGLPKASWWFKPIFDSYLYLHGYYCRYLKFPRKESYLGTPIHPSPNNKFMPAYESEAYANGYTVAGLGPTKIETSLCPMPNIRVGTCPVPHFHKK
ncbi:hypothetical protein BJV82DRAFT_503954 [Fennellomyces sp. T-0311]|nr:hypothetical protein BJV82DRAFT_503954 [Fennellomyces sp. T-0311]